MSDKKNRFFFPVFCLLFFFSILFLSCSHEKKTSSQEDLETYRAISEEDEYREYRVERPPKRKSQVARAIYGEDDRVLIPINESGSKVSKLSKSVIAILYKKSVKKVEENFFFQEKQLVMLKDMPLEEIMPGEDSGRRLCSDQSFATELVIPFCTGFLVGPDIILTAGHCLDRIICKNSYFMFDFKTSVDWSNIDRPLVKDNIYQCSKVIYYPKITSSGDGEDFAILRLDRPVLNRIPLKIRREGNVNVGDEVFAIGHPNGAPMMLTKNGKVKDVSNSTYFKTTLDTFGGNSGSPVLSHQAGGLVEGILSKGKQDFELDEKRQCLIYKKFKEDEGDEEVFSITKISDLISGILEKDNLFETIKNGRFDEINGENFNIIGKKGENLLHLAMEIQSIDLARKLLDFGIKVNSKDDDGWTPLHYAAKNDFSGGIEFLLDNSGNINSLDNVDRTPYYIAISNKANKAADILKQNGAQINLEPSIVKTVSEGKLDVFLDLIDSGKNIDVKNKSGETPLLTAIKLGDGDIVSLLLKKGANPNIADSGGITPLMLAIMSRDFYAIDLLLDTPEINLNSIGPYGLTPIHFAVITLKGKDVDYIKKMVDKGADINIRNSDGGSVLMLAIQNPNNEAIKFFLTKEISHQLELVDITNQKVVDYARGNCKNFRKKVSAICDYFNIE